MTVPNDKKTGGHRTRPDKKDPALWPTKERVDEIKFGIIRRFKAARIVAGYSQERAGQVIGMLRPIVVKMESCVDGSQNLLSTQIVLAAEAFGVPAEWLSQGSGPAGAVAKRAKELKMSVDDLVADPLAAKPVAS